jgi:hypothetical protein
MRIEAAAGAAGVEVAWQPFLLVPMFGATTCWKWQFRIAPKWRRRPGHPSKAPPRTYAENEQYSIMSPCFCAKFPEDAVARFA